MRAILDTSVLISDRADLVPDDAAISIASLAELHFGIQSASTAEDRARRLALLGAVESAFAPVPVGPEVAREWGGLAAAARERGLKPRQLVMDLLIAATARVQGVPLITLDKGLEPLGDLVDLRIAA